MTNIVDRGSYRGIHFPKKQSVPEWGQLRMRCGKCAGMDFEIHIKPVGSQGRLTTLVCLGCLKHFKIDTNGFLEGDGTQEVTMPTDDYVKPIAHTKDLKNG